MKLEVLEKDCHYHIFNRGVNGTFIFKNSDNKTYFLSLISKHFNSKIDVLAYCLMNNHFHFIIKINTDTEIATQAISNLFNAYAKAFNKQQSRTGSLFEKHFRRKRIDDDTYLKNAIIYIHTNPQFHKITDNFEQYEFSSYKHFISANERSLLKLQTDYILNVFDSHENFTFVHHEYAQQMNNDLVSGKIELNSDLQGFKNLAGQKANVINKITHTNNQQDSNNLVDLEKTSMKDTFYQYIQNLQNTITSALETVDGKAKFQEDLWKRPEGGGGRTRVIQNGNVFEKGGVNISAVYGELPETMRKHFGVDEAHFFACGLSLVLHPKNPMVPTVHANWRYFEMYNPEGEIVDSWFGGGQDLTPYYLFEDDAIHFHQVCKSSCNKHNSEFYSIYKKRCDEYFWNTHRNEARGVGGLFFDYCKASEEMTMQNWYNFVTEIGDSFLDAYVPIVEKRKDLSYTEVQRNWQEIRRGRYVEFNLVHDKGTLFGLKTNGRIESILMSLPPHVQWVYDHTPEENSEEAKLVSVLKQPKNWV